MKTKAFVSFAMIVVFFSLSLVILGCGNGDGDSDNASPNATAAGAGGSIVVAARKTPDGVDKDFFYNQEDHTIRAACYEKLWNMPMAPDEGGVIVPDYSKILTEVEYVIAESHTISEDGRTLTVKIKRGIKTHAGNELTAHDVQYTWDRSWALGAVGAFYPKFVLLMDKPNWRVVDDFTWEITTPNLNAVVVPLMSNNDLPILDSKEVKAHATEDDPWATEWMATHDAGSGPYKIVEFSPGNRVVLEAFEDYWQPGIPYYSEIIYKEVPDGSQRALLVQSGAVDCAENVPFINLDQLQENPNVKVWSTRGNSVVRLPVTTKAGPTTDVNFRRALQFLVPMEDIGETVYHGFGSPLLSPLPQDYPMADYTLFQSQYNPDKARELLAQVDIPDGFSMTLYYDASRNDQREVGNILKTSFAEVGLQLTPEGVSGATFYTNAHASKYDEFLYVHNTNTPDPGYALATFYASEGTFNYAQFKDPRVDELLVEGFATLDQTEREPIYRDAQEQILDGARESYIWNPGWQLVTKPGIGGVAWDPSGATLFQFMKPVEQ